MSDANFDDAVKAAADAAGTTATGDVPPAPTGSGAPSPDPVIVPRKGRGRPRGSKTRSRPENRAGEATTREDGPTAEDPLSPDDARKSAAFLLGYADKLIAQFAKTSPLTPEEIEQGADALGPVMAKYAGGAVSPEVIAVVWVAGAYGPRIVQVIEKRRRGALPLGGGSPIPANEGESASVVVSGE